MIHFYSLSADGARLKTKRKKGEEEQKDRQEVERLNLVAESKSKVKTRRHTLGRIQRTAVHLQSFIPHIQPPNNDMFSNHNVSF